ncbi:putative Chromatin modification-related protein EAF3 [Seiridium cardinale]|uniref:Chromatin modification-related protein EAF3 n=1 Tax=Seiridium cardinale TaxID=138064 RepID=A0ABR2X875_9PEZI
MAPSKQAPGPPFSKDEKVLCFHGDLMYEAKITDVRSASDPSNTNFATIKADDAQYKVHYKGWKSSWDDWVTQDRMRKFTDDNKALATQLIQAARLRTAGGSKSAKKAIGKAVGGIDSEMSSARGSEERAANNSYAGRGPRRGRDYELESIGIYYANPWIANKDKNIPKKQSLMVLDPYLFEDFGVEQATICKQFGPLQLAGNVFWFSRRLH